MWQLMHWLEGTERVSWCVMGWPRSRLLMVGSAEKLRPWWPYLEYQPEFVGERSLAYTVWQAVQPLER